MSAIGGLIRKKYKRGLVAVAGTPSADTSFAKRLILVAFDLPNSTAD
jgi:hypothetical protein